MADLDGSNPAAKEPSDAVFDKPFESTLDRSQAHDLEASPAAITGGCANLYEHVHHVNCHARVAELADAQASGACARKGVGVQVPPRAQLRGLQPVKMLQPSKMLQITVRRRLRFAVASARSMQCQQRFH